MVSSCIMLRKHQIISTVTYSNLSEALMQHGHQEFGENDDHNNIVGTDDKRTNKRPQLLCVANPCNKQSHMCQGKNVPEEGVTCSHKPGER